MGRKPNWPPRLVRKPGTAEARTYHAGRWHHCGGWDVARGQPTPAAKAAHARLVARWLADPGSAARPRGEYLLAELLADWGESADGPRTAHARQLLRLAAAKLGPHLPAPAAAFGPAELLAWQAALGERLAANTVRPLRACVLAAFGWAEECGRVPDGHAGRLERAVGRRRKRVAPGRPMRPRPPADPAHVAAALPHLARRFPGAAALLRVHALTGARAAELLDLTAGRVRRSGVLATARGARLDLAAEGVWAADLERHKTAWKGQERVLVFGPRAKRLLAPLLRGRGPGERVFDVRAGRTDGRKRGGDSLKARVHSYWGAVRWACRAAGVPHFSPRQLRQAAADRVRDALGAEHAAAYLGHAGRGTTERHYLTVALKKAAEAARRVG